MKAAERATRDVQMASLSPLIMEVLAGGSTVELTVTGNSMWPMLFHKHSRVRLAPARELKKGDLPLYHRDNGAFVLHRIVAVEKDRYTCCGDNQWRLEPGLRPEQMVAVVTDFCRKDRWMSVKSPVYRVYWRFWVAVRPLRRWVFGGWRRVKRAVGKAAAKLK